MKQPKKRWILNPNSDMEMYNPGSVQNVSQIVFVEICQCDF